jgi:hypothetical protein
MRIFGSEQWRHFNFFQAAQVKDAHDLASPPEIFKAGNSHLSYGVYLQ